MKSIGEIGLKITRAQREFCRYSGVSAELEQRGAGASRPELAWVRRGQFKELPTLKANSRKVISPPPSADR